MLDEVLHMKRHSKGTWEAARREWVTGACSSMTDLSAKTGIPYKTIETRRHRESWDRQRVQVQANAMNALECANEAKPVQIGSLASELATRTHSFLRDGAGLVSDLLGDAREMRALAKGSVADYRELVSGVSVLLGAGRSHLGLDSPAAQGSVNLACQIIVGDLEAAVPGLSCDLASQAEPTQHHHQRPAAAAIDLDAAEADSA